MIKFRTPRGHPPAMSHLSNEISPEFVRDTAVEFDRFFEHVEGTARHVWRGDTVAVKGRAVRRSA